jgi:hypothetical protein
MDFAFFRFITRMDRNIHLLLRKMSTLANRVASVIRFLQSEQAGLKAELAVTKEALATALADDVADDADIAAAQADATAAREAANAAIAKVAELQALADQDAAEDVLITATLDSVVIPEPEVIEPAPEAPAEPEAPASEPGPEAAAPDAEFAEL